MEYKYRAINTECDEVVDATSFRTVMWYARFNARQAETRPIEIRIYREGEYIGSVLGDGEGITYSGPFGRSCETYHNNLTCEVGR